MKTRFSLLMLVAIVFIACSSDSDSNSLPINEENLLGKWHYKGFRVDNQPLQNEVQECSTSNDYMEVLSSHNLTYNNYGADCEINNTASYSWTLEGNQFVNINPDPAVLYHNIYKVLKITDEELVLSRDFHPISPTETEVYRYYYTRN